MTTHSTPIARCPASPGAGNLGRAIPSSAPAATEAAREGASLRLYGVLTWAALLLHISAFLSHVTVTGPGVFFFALLVVATYGTFLTIAALLPVGLLHLSIGRFGWSRWAVCSVAVVLPALAHLMLIADAVIWGMYGFHLNGMIWNLLVTPGGIESMGADAGTHRSFAAIALFCVALQSGLFVLACRWERPRAAVVRATSWRRTIAAFGILVLAHGIDRVTYGLSYAAESEGVLSAASAFPQYGRTRMIGFGRWLGIVPPRNPLQEESRGVDPSSLTLRYPLRPLERAPGAASPNVVWLVSESLRADMLDPEIMPRTMAFAQGGRRFTRHFSAGNGTRMGVFGMFYGLYGSYWFPVLGSARGPVLVDVLSDGGYDIECFTSARFTYPEFDRTVWRRVPTAKLHEGDPTLAGWKNDQSNVTDLLASIDAAPAGRPFFRFLFFESPHAPYRFPKDAVIRPDYEESMNYVTMNLKDPAVVARIKNRYVNACHALDMQLARVYEHLESKGLLANTIVIVTGDHGEEFMEKGRWGHHSAFTDEQVRTPLVIRGAGIAPGVEDSMTSHLDLPATVLARLGVTNPPEDYSLGVDILNGRRTAAAVASGWEDMGLIDGDCKIVLPFSGVDRRQDDVTRGDDSQLPDTAAKRALRASKNAEVVRTLRGMRRFSK